MVGHLTTKFRFVAYKMGLPIEDINYKDINIAQSKNFKK